MRLPEIFFHELLLEKQRDTTVQGKKSIFTWEASSLFHFEDNPKFFSPVVIRPVIELYYFSSEVFSMAAYLFWSSLEGVGTR